MVNQFVTRRVLLLLLGGGLGAEGVLDTGADLLGGDDVAETLVAELEGTLLLSDAEELNHALLHGGEAAEVSNDGLDGADLLLGLAKTSLAGDLDVTGGGLVALVEAGNDAVLGGEGLGNLALSGGHF